MPRVKRSVHARKKRRKLLAEAKGFSGQPRVSYRKAKEQVMKADVHAYRDRKRKKRVFRRLWIIRIKANIDLDRKVLADIAVNDPAAFSAIAAQAKAALDSPA
jgi:large subunit ribosomal protein L20